MNRFKPFFLAVSLIFFFSSVEKALAYIPQRGNVHASLGSFIFQTNYSGRESMSSPNKNGLAFHLLGDISDHGSLEISIIRMSKTYFQQGNGLLVVEKVPTVHASFGYRYWFSEKYSSTLALYTSYPLEDPETLHNEFPQGQLATTTASESYETGLEIGVETEFWAQGRYALFGGAKYLWSLTRNSEEFADQYGILLGIRYFVQGKDAPNQ